MKLVRAILLLVIVLPVKLTAGSGGWLLPKSQLNSGWMISVGISAGRETFIGLPKFGAYRQFPIPYTRCKGPKLGFRQPVVYAGIDGSLFVFFAGAYSVGPTLGYGHGPFSIDNSLTITWITAPESQTEKNWSYNPKVGVNVGPVWIKAGPSFPLYTETSWADWVQIGNVSMNFELLYLVR